jgi:hypothetical protein
MSPVTLLTICFRLTKQSTGCKNRQRLQETKATTEFYPGTLIPQKASPETTSLRLVLQWIFILEPNASFFIFSSFSSHQRGHLALPLQKPPLLSSSSDLLQRWSSAASLQDINLPNISWMLMRRKKFARIFDMFLLKTNFISSFPSGPIHST